MNVIGTNDVNAGNLIFAFGGSGSIIFGFEPSNLSNLLGWYSSDYGVYNAPGVLATNGQTVRTWQNRINNGIDLNQGGASMQPIYSNGAIQFSQNAMSGINPYPLNAPLTYYLATTILSGGAGNSPAYIIKQGPTAPSIRYSFSVNTGAFLAARQSSTFQTSTLKLVNKKNIIYASFSGIGFGSNGEILLGNGLEVFKTGTTFGENTDTIFIIGSAATSSVNLPLKGSIYEILIYTGLHTANEKNQVLTYLSNKWGVSF